MNELQTDEALHHLGPRPSNPHRGSGGIAPSNGMLALGQGRVPEISKTFQTLFYLLMASALAPRMRGLARGRKLGARSSGTNSAPSRPGQLYPPQPPAIRSTLPAPRAASLSPLLPPSNCPAAAAPSRPSSPSKAARSLLPMALPPLPFPITTLLLTTRVARASSTTFTVPPIPPGV